MFGTLLVVIFFFFITTHFLSLFQANVGARIAEPLFIRALMTATFRASIGTIDPFECENVVPKFGLINDFSS